MRAYRICCKRLGIFAATIVLVQCMAIGQSKIGTTAAQFLGIPVGPQAMAMGGAYVASAEDVTTIYWNPGAFVQANRTQFIFSNTNWLVDTKFRWFGFMYNLDGDNAIGLTLTQLDYGEEEVTTVNSPDGNGQRWSAQDISISAAYSRRLTDRFSLGGSVKYVGQTIWNETASGFAFDLGLLFVTNFNNMRLGMSMANFGGDMTLDGRDLLQKVDIDPGNAGSNKNLVGKLKTDPWPMPLVFRVGVAMDVVKQGGTIVTLAADALRPSDSESQVNIGGEIGWNDMLFVRGGYKALFADESQEGLSLGGGIKYNAPGIGSIEVHYSFNRFGLFDNLNTIAVAIGL
jgi:type IX secretion system protein PorV